LHLDAQSAYSSAGDEDDEEEDVASVEEDVDEEEEVDEDDEENKIGDGGGMLTPGKTTINYLDFIFNSKCSFVQNRRANVRTLLREFPWTPKKNSMKMGMI
jgi:hypothetical protein